MKVYKYKRSEEGIERLRQAQLGRKHTPEHRAKIVATLEQRLGADWRNELTRRRIKTMQERGLPLKGGRSPNWRGGRIKVHGGYIKVMSPQHPHRDKIGYVLEHRLVMEKHLGRILDRKEWVHHRNCVKDDNRLENLQVVSHSKPHGEATCPRCLNVFAIH